MFPRASDARAHKVVAPLAPLASVASDLQARAAEAAALLKALGNPDRLLLLCQLAEGERGVNELGSLTGIVQPSLSQQLAVLRGERLVATRREGKHVVYRIASPAALVLLQALRGLFCEPAAGPGRLAGRAAKRPRKETE